MNTLDSFLAGGGVVLLVLAVAFALLTIAMPFLVWATHSQLRTIQHRLDDVDFALGDIRHIVEAIELRLADAPWQTSEEVASRLSAVYLRRSEAAELRVLMLKSRRTLADQLLAAWRKGPPNNAL